ncbi:hypothetical protein HJFPF1_10783 [Paramyrothecium foliicola]|nr:hypothetical protein HJFPF1_10783 [Paramyrothecium foliicola]
MWGPRMPAWKHMNDTMAYVARNQYISQIGTPKVDLAFYQYAAPFNKKVYGSDNLEKLGFTYDYLGPRSLNEKLAVVEGGVLAPDGPAYKALIFDNQYIMEVELAEQVVEFAEAGLPIFVIGAAQFRSTGKTTDQKKVAHIMDTLVSTYDNVVLLETADGLPSALSSLNVLPRAPLVNSSTNSRLYTSLRSTPKANFIFVYNDGNETESIDLRNNDSTEYLLYIFDAWTGKSTPVVYYRSGDDGLSIPLTLAPEQIIILALIAEGKCLPGNLALPPKQIVQEVSGAVRAVLYSNDGQGDSFIALQLAKGLSQVTLSNGTNFDLVASPPLPANLSSWNITVNDWNGGEDRFNLETVVTLHTYINSHIAAWKELDPSNLLNTSGTADYSTSIHTPFTNQTKIGARLHLGPISDSVRIWDNGSLLPPVDLNRSPDILVDITGFLAHPGNENRIHIEAVSALFNRLRAEADQIWTFGISASFANGPYLRDALPESCGISGPVWIEWVEIRDLRT